MAISKTAILMTSNNRIQQSLKDSFFDPAGRKFKYAVGILMIWHTFGDSAFGVGEE